MSRETSKPFAGPIRDDRESLKRLIEEQNEQLAEQEDEIVHLRAMLKAAVRSNRRTTGLWKKIKAQLEPMIILFIFLTTILWCAWARGANKLSIIPIGICAIAFVWKFTSWGINHQKGG